MYNILVTGGAGYIGSHCCKELSKQGFNPIVLDNLINGYKENVKWGEFICGDVGDFNLLCKIFKRYKIDGVMHFAAYAYVGESVKDPMKYYENNLRNTINLLSAMMNHSVELFVFSSSCSTYGVPRRLPIKEDHPQNPINPYGKTKYMIESMLKDFSQAYNLRFVSLRYFNAAGADPEGEIGEKHVPETHLIPLVLDVAAGKRDAIQIFGNDYETPDGTCVRDYIHVSDLARAHIAALHFLLKGGQSKFYNLGNGVGYSVLEIIEKAREITGKPIPIVNAPRRDGDPPILVASNKKAGEELDWTPAYYKIDDIIRTAWEWHRKMD